MNENPMHKDVLERQANVAEMHENPPDVSSQSIIVQRIKKKMLAWLAMLQLI